MPSFSFSGIGRGFLQHRLAERSGPVSALILASVLYMAVHLPSANAMLILAAGVAGFFWGVLYAWRKSLAANIASHIAWDLAVFLIWPFT